MRNLPFSFFSWKNPSGVKALLNAFAWSKAAVLEKMTAHNEAEVEALDTYKAEWLEAWNEYVESWDEIESWDTYAADWVKAMAVYKAAKDDSRARSEAAAAEALAAYKATLAEIGPVVAFAFILTAPSAAYKATELEAWATFETAEAEARSEFMVAHDEALAAFKIARDNASPPYKAATAYIDAIDALKTDLVNAFADFRRAKLDAMSAFNAAMYKTQNEQP